MSSVHLNLNRPVHLARRNVFFERAVDLIYRPMQEMATEIRLEHTEQIRSLLNTAEKHAFFAAGAPTATNEEKDFLHFLRLVADNVQSVHAMMKHQFQLESEEGFLAKFLSTTRDESHLPAMHYQRRAEDILQGLWHVLRLAHTPYQALQKANLAALDEDGKARYYRAQESFEEEANSKFPGTAAGQEAS